MSEELLKNNDVNMGTINENGMNEVPCTDQVNNEQSKGDYIRCGWSGIAGNVR